MKKRYLRLAALTAGVILAAQTGLSAAALSTFDAAYYAAQHPDVAAVCGNDEDALLRHYLDHGIDEGRVPMEDGSYWICDAFGLYCGLEPELYQHPYF